MAVPLTVQLFDAFLGSGEGIHSIILPDYFSSGGSQNVYIDKFARVAAMKGYTKQNTSDYTTNGGASLAIVRGLHPYRGTAGGSITRKLLFVLDDGVNEWEIWSSTDNGVTASFLYDAGATAVGQVPDSAQFGDDLYITNGKVAARVYDGTSIAAVGLTQSPTPSAAASANSGNLKGNYKYKLVSTIAGVRQAGSAASASDLIVDTQVDVTWTADSNGSVDGYELYRTTGTGTTFYYLTTISGRLTVAYTDNIADQTLLENRLLEEHGDNPPISYFCEPHKQRMWWLRTDSKPTYAYWSDPGAPESVYAFNFLDFSDSETVGDQITGALGNFEGLFVVFTEKAVWTVSGSGDVVGDIVDFKKTRTNAQTGSVTHRSVVRIPAGSKYVDQEGKIQTTTVSSIAYWTPLGDIRLFDGDNDLIVSHPVRETVGAFSYANRHKIHALVDAEREQAIWFFPSSTVSEPDKAVVWNYRHGIWYVWTSTPFSASAFLDTSTDAHVLLTGESSVSKGAYVYAFFDGASFDGSNIHSKWMTKALYGVNEEGQPALSNTKRWRWVDVLFRLDHDLDITLEWLPGNATDSAGATGTTTIEPDALTLTTAAGSTILTADGSSILITAADAQKLVLLQTGAGDFIHDEGIRLRISANSTQGSWSLEAFQLAYQLLPGLKRRMNA